MRIRETKFTEDGRKMVILEDGLIKLVHTDDVGCEYIYADNKCDNLPKRNLRPNSPVRGLFNHRVKDMYDTVVACDGDCIQITNHTPHVVYYLDRTVGNELREKFLQGWKNTKFGYAIEVNGLKLNGDYKYSFSECGYTTITRYEEAETILSDIMKLSSKIAANIIEQYAACSDRNDNTINEIITNQEMENNIDLTFSALGDIVFDIMNDDGTGYRHDDHLPNRYMPKIVQAIIHSMEDCIEEEVLYSARIFPKNIGIEPFLKDVSMGISMAEAAENAGIELNPDIEGVANKMMERIHAIQHL